jgi:hypothetical protein
MGLLVDRFVRHHLRQGVYRGVRLTAVLLDGCQLQQEREVVSFEQVAASDGPVLVAVLGQEVTHVQFERGRVRGQRAGLVRMRRGALEVVDVHAATRRTIQGDHVPLQVDIGRRD